MNDQQQYELALIDRIEAIRAEDKAVSAKIKTIDRLIKLLTR